MHSIKAITLISAASFSIVFASPTLLTRQNGVTCQTSSGSPVTGDVTLVINEVRGLGGSCPQTNGSGSGKTLPPPFPLISSFLSPLLFHKAQPTRKPHANSPFFFLLQRLHHPSPTRRSRDLRLRRNRRWRLRPLLRGRSQFREPDSADVFEWASG